ncbi:hypothetical protein V1T76_08560 [Roseibium sp. FZY0029]|uniref:hypothetical protein n=1 Tax=Roseibium sp. FZY0029 TaxID=3116647 RepID=UPI002EC91138|nr:hypothetical protein [Roseibium sp. FZY0029]
MASQPGVQRIHAFSGEPVGIDITEAKARIVEDADPKLLMKCLTEFERGLLTGRAAAKEGEEEIGI